MGQDDKRIKENIQLCQIFHLWLACLGNKFFLKMIIFAPVQWGRETVWQVQRENYLFFAASFLCFMGHFSYYNNSSSNCDSWELENKTLLQKSK